MKLIVGFYATMRTMKSFSFLLAVLILGIAVAEEPAADAKQAKVIAQADDGTVLLHARDAAIRGKTVRYEPQPNKNTIGYWTNASDWVSWDFTIQKPGKFIVEPLQGCGKGSGGAEVEFSIGEQTLAMTVKDTGHFQNFVAREIGTVALDKAGRYTLSVKPKTKPGVAVMDLRQVTLKPVKE